MNRNSDFLFENMKKAIPKAKRRKLPKIEKRQDSSEFIKYLWDITLAVMRRCGRVICFFLNRDMIEHNLIGILYTPISKYVQSIWQDLIKYHPESQESCCSKNHHYLVFSLAWAKKLSQSLNSGQFDYCSILWFKRISKTFELQRLLQSCAK